MMVWVWIAVLLFMIIVEIITPTALVSIWFAAGAFVSLTLSLFDVNIWVQGIVFIVVSLLALVIIRPIAAKYIKKTSVPTNFDRYIGQTGVVTKPIEENNWGQVKIQNTTWSAKGENNQVISEGEKVQILSVEGAKVIVKKI